MEYEKRPCEICGREYVPRRSNQRCCLSEHCRIELRKKTNREYMHKSRGKASAWAQAYALRNRAEHKVPKPDTIVAEGYAERQIAASLAKAGKVRVEL